MTARVFLAVKALLALLMLAPGMIAPAAAQTVAWTFTNYSRFDARGNLIGRISPDPDWSGPLRHGAVRNTYDSANRLIRVETGELQAWQPAGVAPANWPGFTVTQTLEIGYDARGRKIKEELWGWGERQTVTQYSYDPLGRLTCTAVRMNPLVFATLPTDACELSSPGTQGPDRITRNVYDPAGQLLQEQRAYRVPSHQQNYATYSYSASGRRTSVTDANNNRAEMTYDAHDRQQSWIFPSPSAPGQVNYNDNEQYGYDNNGNRTSRRTREGLTFHYQYDSLNRMTAKIVPERTTPWLDPIHTRDVYYSYDSTGLPRTARFDSQSGQGVTIAYNGFGRPWTTEVNLGGASRLLITDEYDSNGNRMRLIYPNGATAMVEFDGLNRPAQTRETWTDPLTGFTYNAQGNQNGRSYNGGTAGMWGAGYNAVGRLGSFTHDLPGSGNDVTVLLVYNPAGQITSRRRLGDSYAWPGAYNVSRSYSRNGLNQYHAIATAGGPTLNLTYDVNGNLRSDGSNNYVYDTENRLVTVNGAQNGALQYDPLGRLFQLSAGANVTQFLYDGDELVAEYAGAGAMQRRYVHGPGTDDPLVWYEDGERRYLLTDERGSVIGVVNSAGGIIAKNSYDEWGIPGAGNIGRFQYTGQAWLAELGLYHYKARIYSPTLGRFLQVDPVGYDDQVNLYSYVGNDPLNESDPTGMQGESWGAYVYNHTIGPRSLYDRVIVRPFWNIVGAISDSPVGDPGVWMAVQQAGPPGRVVGSVGSVGARGLRAVTRFARSSRSTRVTVDSARHPQAAAHIRDAQAAGHPRTLTVERPGAAANRRESLRGTQRRAGADRDEYPPAMFREGGNGASVRHIDPSDNRGAGASIARQCRQLRDGDRVTIICT